MARQLERVILAFVGLGFCVTVEEVRGQAFCGLRDPVRNIYKVYPEADAYRSIVRSVDKRTRSLVSERLPFTLHFNELGKHTLYVPLREGQALGLVRVRSEKGKWGLVEIAWSLDLHLKVRGFHFQRCRDKSRLVLVEDLFASQLIGKDFGALRKMLSEDGISLNTDKISVPKEHAGLAVTTLRSALKTLAMTDIVWSSDLRALRAIREAGSLLPNVRKLTEVREIYTPDVHRALEAIEQGRESVIQRKTVEVYLAVDEEDRFQGTLLKVECVLAEEHLDLWCAVTPDYQIYRVDPIPDWPGEEFQEAFERLEGMTEQDIHDCATATEMVGAEVIVISRFHTME